MSLNFGLSPIVVNVLAGDRLARDHRWHRGRAAAAIGELRRDFLSWASADGILSLRRAGLGGC